ncbi:TCR/Tet family MFS transporter [Burkholderia alba]|uniref:TCR/Tet family MFS transporter n=1 Tax=Burkholderia alba TaxID=2683677 RepID=UPI002B05CE75|nr:TCR/Tet family MFS transporter [Burkholderia alba]
MKRTMGVAALTVGLDALGAGCVMPVLPGLLRALGAAGASVAWHYGVLIALYAAMQVACAPLLGRLSDRYGRRPVLLASLAGATLDYLVAAQATGLAMVYAARIVAGITGATGSVASSCIADAAAPRERARYFGLIGACYGGGMIAGPVLGGLLGGVSLQAPFVMAALLNGAACVVAWRLLPATQRGGHAPESAASGPRRSLRFDANARRLIGVYFVMQWVGQVPATLWTIFGADRFHWNAGMIGGSLAGFGVLHLLVQARVAGPAVERWGERRVLIAGIGIDATGYVLVACAASGWQMIPAMLCLGAGGVGMPAMQGLLSRQVEPDRQGELQGVLARVTGVGAIGGPLVFSALHTATAASWDGWTWLAGASLYLLCAPVWLSRRVARRGDARQGNGRGGAGLA